MAAYLDTILEAHRAVAAADTRDERDLLEQALAAPPARPFIEAITGANAPIALISEIKRRSPSKGDLDPGLDPAEVAAAYERGGAACLSVLTDHQFFGGSPEDLAAARAACTLPVLRKDFTVSVLDVYDARRMGADAVLLIAAALSDAELATFLEAAERCSLAALVEVHDDEELARALAAGAQLVGVNQRDLHTFEVDHERALRLGTGIPHGVVSVAESGIRDAADVTRLADAGFRAVLVGETLVRAGDRSGAVAELLGVAR
jgi:indole-3-glycerol phosphate synthase